MWIICIFYSISSIKILAAILYYIYHERHFIVYIMEREWIVENYLFLLSCTTLSILWERVNPSGKVPSYRVFKHIEYWWYLPICMSESPWWNHQKNICLKVHKSENIFEPIFDFSLNCNSLWRNECFILEKKGTCWVCAGAAGAHSECAPKRLGRILSIRHSSFISLV